MQMAATDLVQYKLAQLKPDVTDVLVTVAVLSKSEPHYFDSKRQEKDKDKPQSDGQRGVLSFTVRDAPQHVVNCKYWGSKQLVEQHYAEFKIGDILDISHPRVVFANDTDRFQPKSTLPIALVLNEDEAELCRHNEHDEQVLAVFRRISSVPHKPLSSVLQLRDIQRHCTGQGQNLDLLVAVGSQRAVRQIYNARLGRSVNCLELAVFDRSYTDGMLLCIWSADWISRAEQFWQPRKTTLHLIDVRVTYSSYLRCNKLTLSGCTLVYENPPGPEAKELCHYAASAPTKELDVFAMLQPGALPAPQDIKTQMSVKQIYARAEGELCADSEDFTAVVYALVTKFDIDGHTPVVQKKCKNCQRYLARSDTICSHEMCQLAFSMNDQSAKFELFYNVNVHLSDHTGTLVEARLCDTVARRLLQVDADAFHLYSAEELHELKWSILLEHYEVKLLIKKATLVRKTMTAVVVDMREVDLDEFSKKVLTF